MIYFFVKDLVLSGLVPGRIFHRSISCAAADKNKVEKLIKAASFKILIVSDEPIKDHSAIDWQDMPRLK